MSRFSEKGDGDGITGNREGFTKNSSCSFGFCPNEGGGHAQIFGHIFTNCIWVNLGMGREGETPAQIFWHISVKKSGTICPNWGGGGEGVEVI